METFGVFWDIENLAYHKSNDGAPLTMHVKIDLASEIAHALPRYMSLRGYVPHVAWQLAFASKYLPGGFQHVLAEQGYDLHASRRVTHNAADGDFLRAIWEAQNGHRPILPHLMCLITGDHDFFQHLCELRQMGCRVWVFNWCRTQTSRLLVRGSKRRRGADRFISFSELLEQAPFMETSRP